MAKICHDRAVLTVQETQAVNLARPVAFRLVLLWGLGTKDSCRLAYNSKKMLGLGSLAIGFILTLLGATRIALANVERKYFVADESQSSDFPPAPDAP